jgi:hypothetical protein
MANGDAAAVPEMLTRRRAAPGNCAAKASTTMPPSDGPITVSRRSIPNERIVSKPARAMSSTERSGKVRRYGLPVAGSSDAGPVEPKQLPRELTQMTKNWPVSIASSGPIMRCHQPSLGSPGEEAACADGDNPVKSNRALLRASFSVPQVSYAIRAPCSTPPRHMGKGSGMRAYLRAPVLSSRPAVGWCSAAGVDDAGLKALDHCLRQCLRTTVWKDTAHPCRAASPE